MKTATPTHAPTQTGRTFPKRMNAQSLAEAGRTMDAARYFSSGCTFDELTAAIAGKPDRGKDATEPRQYRLPDMLVVENFLSRIRQQVDETLEEVGREGDPQIIAQVKAQSHALDEFTRLIMSSVRVAYDDLTAPKPFDFLRSMLAPFAV